MMERARCLLVVLTFVFLVAMVAMISALAHIAKDFKALLLLLYGITAAFSLVTLLIAAISMIVNITGTRGTVTFNSVLLALVGLAIGLPLLRPVRATLSRVMPFDSDSPADMTGLSVLMATAVYFGGTSLEAAANINAQSVGATELISQAVALVFIAYFGVGFLTTRDVRGATDRLGLRPISLGQFAQAVVLVAGLFAVTIVASILTVTFEPHLDQQIQENLTSMTQNLSSFGGALILGISAGVGEEVLFRGAIQPKYGIVFTSIVFASLHVQYGISLTVLGIFFVSVLLGIERKRVNTTASLVTHVVYDVLAVMIPLFLH